MRSKLSKSLNVPQIVCVSENQMANMNGIGYENISTYINNFITTSFYNRIKPTSLNSKKIVYIGALFPNKGCHNLIKIWSLVNRMDPSLELIVIGGSSVYGSKIKKGSIGVTDRAYELLINWYLQKVDDKKSVRFVGSKNWNEILELISDARVGVVNPSYFRFDETFCMSAVEMQAGGLPIVSRYRNDGLVSTIDDEKTGYLCKSDKDIASAIVRLSNDDILCRKMSVNARKKAKQFLDEDSIDSWVGLLNTEFTVKKIPKCHFQINDLIRLRDDFKMTLYKIARRLL